MSIATTIDEPGIAREDILHHLEALLADRRFAAAERNARFLRYVVERTLEGKANEIKETVVAIEVYGRSGTYDPKADSIVRVEASRLRQKLRNYYENEGRDGLLRIHLPSGSYVPQFERVGECSAAPVPPTPPDETTEQVPDVVAPIEGPRNRRPFFARQALVLGAAFAFLTMLVFMQTATGSRVVEIHDPDALAALQEGIALLQQDPHTAQAENGAPKTLIRAIERLEFAVAREPKLARAWATLAEAYDYVYPYAGRDRAEDARRAEAAARTAVALDPKLTASHHMLGLVLAFIKWDLPQAEISYKQALALDPYNVYAIVEYADILRETGRVAEAAEQIRKARALLPTLPQLAAKDAEIQLDLGRTDAAVIAANSAIEARADFLRAHVALGLAYEMKGDSKRALELYEHVLKIDPLERRALPAYGYLLARTGESARAREIASRLEKINSTVRNCAFQVAVVYAGLGEHDTALEWLERAWHTRQPHFPFAAVEYRFRNLHQNTRFQQLLSRVGLKPVA